MPQPSEPNSRDVLERLDFGALAAERELDRLPHVFVPTAAFLSLRDRGTKKVVVLGNRGTGKTAVLAMLAKSSREAGAIVVQMSPEDYAYELLAESLAKERAGAWAKQGAYAAAWKYLLYMTAMKAVIGSRPGLKTGPAKRIYNYLRDTQSNAPTNPIGTLISYLKRLEGVKLGKFDATLKARELEKLYKLEEINVLLDDLETVCRGTPAVLLIDELDKGWDASEDAIAFVAGLFHAGTALSVRTPHVRVVLSLRRELFDSIPSLYDDAQKVRDTLEIIEWPADRLFKVIAQRIRVSLGLSNDLSDSYCWHYAMPKQLGGRPSFEALLDFTLWRPRELIQLCGHILDVAKHSSEDLPFTVEEIDAARNAFASDRFADFVSEYKYQYPDLGSVLETFRATRMVWSRDDLEFHCLRLVTGELLVGPAAAWCHRYQPAEMIELLWRVGFLRARIASSADEPARYVGAYQVRTANVRNSQAFAIHDLFARCLDVDAQASA